MKAASQKIRHVHLELGGKAPVIVFGDADIDAVVETIQGGAYFNAGQDCAQPCRIMVEESVYDRVVAETAAAVAGIRIGTQHDPDTEMGPLISAAQRDRVAGFVERARASAEIACGGAAPDGDGFFYAPTVVANVDNDAEIACDEVFGPVVTISRFTDADEALRIANASPYGSLLCLDEGCRAGDVDVCPAALWLHLGEHAWHGLTRNAVGRDEGVWNRL